MNIKNNIVELSIIFLAINFFLLSGCSNRIQEQDSDKYLFDKKMKEFLGSDINIINSLNGGEVQLMYIELPLNSIKDKKIIKLLRDDGWILKGSGVSVDTYCLGVRNSINIASPILFNATDYKGNKVKVTKNNVDIISYSYNKWGG